MKLPVVRGVANRAGRLAVAAAGAQLRRAGWGRTGHLTHSTCVSPFRTLQGKRRHAHPFGKQQMCVSPGVLTLEPHEPVPGRRESVGPGLVPRGSFCLTKSPRAPQGQAPGLPSPWVEVRRDPEEGTLDACDSIRTCPEY